MTNETQPVTAEQAVSTDEIDAIRKDQWSVIVEHLTNAGSKLREKLLKDQSNKKAWHIHRLLRYIDQQATEIERLTVNLKLQEGWAHLEGSTLRESLREQTNKRVEAIVDQDLLREALRWALDQANINSAADLGFDLRISGNQHEHLRSVLLEVMGEAK